MIFVIFCSYTFEFWIIYNDVYILFWDKNKKEIKIHSYFKVETFINVFKLPLNKTFMRGMMDLRKTLFYFLGRTICPTELDRLQKSEKAEKLLVEEVDFVKNLLEYLPLETVVVDENGIIISVNKRMRESIRHMHPDNHNPVGKKMYLEYAKHHRTNLYSEMMECIEKGIPKIFPELPYGDKGRLLSIEMAPLPNKAGAVIKCEDITDEKIRAYEVEKSRRMESIGLLAGGIAHDFNNLLAGIMGHCELASLECKAVKSGLGKRHALYEKMEQALGYFEEINKGTDKGKRLAGKLLTFSKGGEPKKEPANLFDIVRGMADFALAGRKAKANVNTPSDLYCVDIDKTQIEQVLINLLVNADEAMTGGTIEITAKNIEKGNEYDAHLENRKYVEVSVKDTGKGIPENIRDKIFDPFFTTKQKGTGLGLATVYSVVRKHEGYIGFESSENGTTFHFYLPATETSNAESTDSLSNAGSSPRSQTIRKSKKVLANTLVLDDEPTILLCLEKILGYMGYTVVCAKSGEEAITAYENSLIPQNQKIDFVIFDLTVPGKMGGKATLDEMVKKYGPVKAIATSGYSDDPIISNPTDHGFTASLRKPFSIDELRAALKKVK